jgi:hypothetical protein
MPAYLSFKRREYAIAIKSNWQSPSKKLSRFPGANAHASYGLDHPNAHSTKPGAYNGMDLEAKMNSRQLGIL